MGRRVVKRAVGAVLFAAALLWCGGVTAQQHPERRHLRAGNRSYEAQEYAAGAEAFREALAKEPSSFAPRSIWPMRFTSRVIMPGPPKCSVHWPNVPT